MTRWLMEWFTVSFVGIFGLGIMYVFSKLWVLVPAQVAESSLGVMEFEGKIALTMLFIIVVGCVKLFSGKNSR